MTDTKQQNNRSTLLVQAVSILSVLLIAGAGIGAYRLSLRSGIEESLQAIEAAGYPVTRKQLEASYAYPEGTNAADSLAKARKRYRIRPSNARWMLVFSHGGFVLSHETRLEEQIEGLESFLDSRQDAMDLLYKATESDGCRYEDIQYGRFLGFRAPHFLGGLRGATILILEAFLHTERQRSGLALRPLLAALRIADTFRQEPSMLAQHERLFCIYRFSRALQFMLSRSSFEAPVLEALRTPLAEAEDPRAVERAYVAQRVLGTSLYRAQKGEQDRTLSLRGRFPLLGHVYRPAGLLEMDMAYFLEKMEGLIAVSRLPWPKRLAPFKDLARELGETPAYLLGSKGFFDAVPHGIVEDLELVARVRTARAALSVELFRLEEGRLPETLDELVPRFLEAVPQDPYNGNLLQYTVHDEGYVVYSVGVNGVDDGGEGFPLNERLRSSLDGIVQTMGMSTIDAFGFDTTFEVLR